jgi:hypothetical protein
MPPNMRRGCVILANSLDLRGDRRDIESFTMPPSFPIAPLGHFHMMAPCNANAQASDENRQGDQAESEVVECKRLED